MNAEDALIYIESCLDSSYLSQTQRNIFRAVWEGQSYVQIARTLGYDYSYIKDMGAKIWRLLSNTLGKKVTKANVKTTITGLIVKVESYSKNTQNIAHNTAQDIPPTYHLSQAEAEPQHSWEESLDVSHFCGRETEQISLEQWLLDERCRLISIIGIGGIGKTALAAQLSHQAKVKFDYVIWRSLRQAPQFSEFLDDILSFLSKQPAAALPRSFRQYSSQQYLTQLLTYLRQHRCLLILDHFEAVLQPNRLVRDYSRDYENYGRLLECIADEIHQSSVIITSREKPRGLAWREREGVWVRSLQLSGLSLQASQKMLSNTKLVGTTDLCTELIQCYGGNPLALKIASTTIHSIFEGRVADFLDYGSILFGDLWELLDNQFNRLSSPEKAVMDRLAINRELTSFSKLQTDIIPALSHRALLEAVESLKARSLIQVDRTGITQQPMVMEYVTERLAAQFYAEI